MKQLVLAMVVALGVGTTLAYAQEADLTGAESRLQLPVFAAFPNEAFVVTQEQADRFLVATGPINVNRTGNVGERMT